MNKEKIWKEEAERETIKMFKYIIDNIKGDIELVPFYDGDNDSAIGIGVPWALIDVGGHKIFYKHWVKLDADSTLLVRIVRRTIPGVCFSVKDKNSLEMIVYSNDKDEDWLVRNILFSEQGRDNWFKKARKELNVTIKSF